MKRIQGVRTALVILLIILLALAGFLGYLLYSGQGGGLSDFWEDEVNTPSGRENNTPPVRGGESGDSMPDPFNFPGEDATNEERLSFYEDMIARAETAGSIEVGECNVEPTVYQAKLGSVIQFSNQDSVDRILDFSEEMVVTVPAGGTTEMTADIEGRGVGIYGYGCRGDDQGVSGVLIIQ